MKCPDCVADFPIRAFDNLLPEMEAVLYRDGEEVGWICSVHGMIQED